MITAEELYVQSDIRPTDFGVEVVPKLVTDKDEQRALAVTHIDTKILPEAISEVSVPFIRASGGQDLPLSMEYLLRRYPNISEPSATSFNGSLQRLYDAAVKSYARAEINDQINSNNDSYDKDSNKFRTTANEQLEKLLEAMRDLDEGRAEDVVYQRNGGIPTQASLTTEFTF